uniref:Tubulin polyglutamylase complex subunit 1-like C-terminal domain-containing protein n=1 Tax=Micromonas pusilla TaxID=38833 RepID=A0A7S0I7K8_MICPS|mmetsp:Transcript_10833/g.45123  ORF Transcript_10833/g.45123 Transcript_10833/m.45123 type:complete len:289 (+) Transcript_10833:636-1502(+)
MDATAAPPPGTRPPVDVASFDRSQLSVYLKDVVTLALENRPEDPIAFASDYLRRVLGGAGAVARAHQYLSLSPHTRRAFTDNALLAFEVLSGDEEGEKPVPGREFNQLIDALLEDAPSAIAERIRDVLRTTDDAEVRWWEFQRATKACHALRELLEELERLYERRGGFTAAGTTGTPDDDDDDRALLEPGCAFEVSRRRSHLPKAALTRVLYETLRLEREAIPYPWGPIGAQVRDMGQSAGAALGDVAGSVVGFEAFAGAVLRTATPRKASRADHRDGAGAFDARDSS